MLYFIKMTSFFNVKAFNEGNDLTLFSELGRRYPDPMTESEGYRLVLTGRLRFPHWA